jgi:hypothetical protein
MIIQFSVWGHEKLSFGEVPFATESSRSLIPQHVQIRGLTIKVDRSVAVHRGVNIVLCSDEDDGNVPRSVASNSDSDRKFAGISPQSWQMTIGRVKASADYSIDDCRRPTKIPECERNLLVVDSTNLEFCVALPKQFIINEHISALDISKRISGLFSGVSGQFGGVGSLSSNPKGFQHVQFLLFGGLSQCASGIGEGESVEGDEYGGYAAEISFEWLTTAQPSVLSPHPMGVKTRWYLEFGSWERL